MTTYNASLLVNTENHEEFARAVETMSRALAGLGLEGIDGSLMVDRDNDDEANGESND